MSQCATCHAGCCRTYVVPVTGADILGIMAQQKLSFWDVACRWADPDGGIALKYAPHFFFQDAPRIPFVIALLQRESGVFPGSKCCQFLDEGAPTSEHPLGVSRCGIYGARPAACRVFPTKFDRSNELAVLCDVPAQGKAGADPVYRLCPRPWKPEDLNPIEQVQHLVVARYEMNFFFKLAAGWNARPGNWREFPRFLQLVYANRVIAKDQDDPPDVETVPLRAEPFPRIAA